MSLNLLEKSELWIENVMLNNVNLTKFAAKVAETLQIDHKKVMVVDVRPDHITLDILQREVEERNILGKEKCILEAISAVEGVTVLENAAIHSDGILGLICMDPEEAREMTDNVRRIVNQVQDKVSHRAIVLPTGFELTGGMVEDTNTPYLAALLEENGFKVATGRPIEDDVEVFAARLEDAVSRAYGLIVTTGGVGAEDKDVSIEGLLHVDPDAATPYILKFEQGTGRHVKDGVRIGVGQVGPSRIVCLPGPHDEVRLAAVRMVEGLKDNEGKVEMASNLALALTHKYTCGHDKKERGGNRNGKEGWLHD